MNRTLVKKTVRELRKNSTPAEEIFWEAVRDRKIKGRKFQRQFPIWFDYEGIERFFIADFCCCECKIVIEIDGIIHQRRKDYDELRTFILSHHGYHVVRFKNEEIESGINAVVSYLEKLL